LDVVIFKSKCLVFLPVYRKKYGRESIHLLEKNLDKIDWSWLSENPNGLYLLENNTDKIDWDALSQNPNTAENLCIF